MEVTRLVRLLNDRVEQYPPRMLAWEISGNAYYLIVTMHWAHDQYHNRASISLSAIEAAEDSSGMLTAFIDHMIYELRWQQLRDHQIRVEEDFRAYFPPLFTTGEGGLKENG